MSAPKLTTARSGYGGRGYVQILGDGTPVPGVTTVLNALDKPGVLQWSVDQVAAYAALNADVLLTKTEEQAFGMLRFYHSRAKETDFDDPMVDLRNAHTGVLHDLSQLGTLVHEWIEADLNDWLEPEIVRREQEEMIVAYLEWKQDQDIVVHATEATLFGDGYAGTADAFLTINGVSTLVDFKTSRAVHETHYAQLAALGECEFWAREVPEGTEGAVGFKPRKADKEFSSWWVKDNVPTFMEYAVLQVRPDDYDTKGVFVPAFAKLHKVPHPVIGAGWGLFEGALKATYAQKAMREALK